MEMWSMSVVTTLVCLHWMELCKFGLTARNGFLWSSSLGCSILFGTEWNILITKSQRVRAEIPTMRKPASREMISASVELCETEVCFLHIQLIGTNVWFPKIHKTPSDVLSLRDLLPKPVSWNNPSLRCCAVFPTEQNCRYSLAWWMCEIKRAKRLSQAFVRLVIDRASLFTDHRISSLPIRAKHRQFRTICEQTVDNSPTDSLSSLNWWSSMRLCEIVEPFYSQIRNIFPHINRSTHFFTGPYMSWEQEEIVSASGFSQALASSFSLAPAEILASNISL